VGTVAVTGSASGLGHAVSAQLEGQVDAVIGVDLHKAEVIADLSDDDGRKAAVKGVLAISAGVLDGLVVAAGLGPHLKDRAAIVSVNFFGAVALLDGLVDALGAGTNPAAVAVASNSATVDPSVNAELVDACLAGDETLARSRASVLPGNTVYASSKAALARAVRRRVQPWGEAGVRLNAIAPGPVETPLLQASRDDPELGPAVELLPIPLGRTATPAEIASTITFLLSPAAGYVHGSVLFADGGSDALLAPDRI
jgi:NAD(P)-dependent dehydrogenase (short-subunit alcohol dehydrogenase family)